MTAIPEQMKHDTWTFYVYARSNNPEIAVPYTRKLVSNLKVAMDLMGETQYNDLLDKCLIWANEAIKILSDATDQRGWGKAMINSEAAVDAVGFLIYDTEKRWAITQSGAFKFPGKEVKA